MDEWTEGHNLKDAWPGMRSIHPYQVNNSFIIPLWYI